MINRKFSLDKSFQILYRIERWINEGSGWTVELSLNISTYGPLSGSSYRHQIHINNDDQKCFFWCHVRHIHPVKTHPERITLKDKELVINNLLMILIMMELNFL